jgi:hypothetical protein
MGLELTDVSTMSAMVTAAAVLHATQVRSTCDCGLHGIPLFLRLGLHAAERYIAMRGNGGFTSGPPWLFEGERSIQSSLMRRSVRVQHAARPGFRILELQLSPTQKVP